MRPVGFLLCLVLPSLASAESTRVDSLGVFHGASPLDGGSLFLEDPSNVYFNPVYVNRDGQASLTVRKSASASVFAPVGDFALGASFGRDVGVPVVRLTGLTHEDAAEGVTFATTDTLEKVSSHYSRRAIELFFGGSGAVRWGVGFLWNNGGAKGVVTNTVIDPSYSQVGLSLGVEWHALQAFAGFQRSEWKMATKKRQNETDYAAAVGVVSEESTPWWLGLRYVHPVASPFLLVTSETMDVDLWDGSKKRGLGKASKGNLIAMGVGRSQDVGTVTTLHGGLALEWLTQEVGDANRMKSESSTLRMPINVGLEYDLASWSVVRLGATMDVWNERSDETETWPEENQRGRSRTVKLKETQAGTADFRLGTGFVFDALTVDAVLGLQQGRNLGFDGNTFADVEATYSF